MTPEAIAAIVVALLGAAAALLPKISFGGGLRGTLRRDVEMYKSLPEESEQREAWLKYIDLRLARIVAGEVVHSRDSAGIGVAGFILATGVGGTILTYSAGGYWQWLYVPIAVWCLFGIAGMATSLPRRRRDEKGNAIRSEASKEEVEPPG